MNRKHLIAIGLMCIASLSANAQTPQKQKTAGDVSKEQAKELVLHFRFDRSLVDSGYRDNHATLSALHELFTDTLIASRIDSIRIRAYSSPEGNTAYNLLLARRRARAVKGYLVWKYPNIDQYRIRTSAQVENWKALRDIAENTPDMPCREEVLQILALDKPNEHIGALLKKLNTGIAYRYLSRHILPHLRNASICTVYMRPLKHPAVQQPPAPLSAAADSSSLPFVSPAHAEDGRILAAPHTAGQSALHTGQDSLAAPHTAEETSPALPATKRAPLFAVKTNLLFDAALMPNVEVEVPIGKRFSLNGELMFPWWLMDGDKYCLQILMGGLEGRYWLGSRKSRMDSEVLTGHFLGLYAGGGKYDLQWKENGYQGEFFIAAGVSYGYAHKIARNLRLEYNIGIGLLRTDYRHYHAQDNYQTLLWQENGKYTWIGPTKLKISLVWMLTRKAGK